MRLFLPVPGYSLPVRAGHCIGITAYLLYYDIGRVLKKSVFTLTIWMLHPLNKQDFQIAMGWKVVVLVLLAFLDGVSTFFSPTPSIQVDMYHCRSKVVHTRRTSVTRSFLTVMNDLDPNAGTNVKYQTVEDLVGNTPLVRLQRLVDPSSSNAVLAKLEGNNPAGSVKDRPALNMIAAAEARGDIAPGRDTLIEATSGNTGIALAMAAAVKGYRLVLIMPEHMSEERRATMRVYGAEIVSVSRDGGMEEARDLALEMQKQGRGVVLNQFANSDNPQAHYLSTGPEIWRDTCGTVTHFVSSMGTTGTIMGVSRYLKEMNPDVQIVGVEPSPGSAIPGIRKWPKEYLPSIFEEPRVDRKEMVSQAEAEETARALAAQEGIFCGISSGGAVAVALRLSKELRDATIVTIVCDRGDRYLSTGVF